MSHSVCPGMRVGVCIRTVISKAQARPFSLTRPKYSVLPCTRHGLRPQEMDCVHPSAHSTTLPVDHFMARRGFNTHPLEEFIQGLGHNQLAAMYSRSEVKPSLSTAVSCQEIDFVRPSAHSTTLPVDHLMARRGLNTHLVEVCTQGSDHSQLAAMYSRGEVKPSLSTRHVMANRGGDYASPHLTRMSFSSLDQA